MNYFTKTLAFVNKFLLKSGAVVLALGVALGAFGAHGLASILSEDQLATFNTGIRYHFYHGFGMLIIGILLQLNFNTQLRWAGWAFLIGIFLFSGSIYVLACRDLLGISSWTWIGAITPFGGLSFIIGWVFLFLFAHKN